MKVNICGIPHDIVEVEDSFGDDFTMGQIIYSKALIQLNKDMAPELKSEALCHEILHGILFHLGFEQAEDEHFVQSVANAINQAFIVRETGA